MFSNLKSKKRITQLLIAVLVVALTATGSVLLFDSFVPEAKAVSVTTESELNGAFAAGGTQTITLSTNITVSGKLSAIPSGANITLDMNGKSITWSDIGTGNAGIISTSYPFADTYWGLITNNGTLTITNTGTIANYHIRTGNGNGSGQDNYGHKSAAIVNNGTLTVGSGVTVKNYACQSNESDDAYQDMFIYSHAIYNTGTVFSSGTIRSASMAQGSVGGSTNSYACAYSYGIFGGNVYVTGGNIYSEAKSGFTEDYWTTGSKGNKAWNFAIGVYSNNAIIYGNSAITVNATSWRDQKGDYNIWGRGDNMSWGVGVLYSGTNYPYIGADVNIDAAFTFPGDNKTSYAFPEYDNNFGLSWTRYSSSEPGSYGRRAAAVAGVSAAMNAAMYGGQSSETTPNEGAVFGISRDSGFSSTIYKSELEAYTGSGTTVSSSYVSQSGGNSQETQHSYITMGAPGNNIGGQYMVYYRYRNTSGAITSASTAPDTAINSKMVFTPANGVFTTDATVLSKSSGGDVTNSYFYQLLGTYYVAKTDGQFGTGATCDNISNTTVTTKGTAFDSLSMSSKNSYFIWVDYQAKAPTNVKVVAENSGTAINALTTNTSFETTYTGKSIVPGTDFNIGVIDMDQDTDVNSDDTNDNTDATSFYSVTGTDSSKVLLQYSYSSDGSTYTSGLPKDVGTYTIKVVVPSDTDISRSGAGNRNGGTYYLTCKITQATPVISGASTKSGTYGSNMSELIPVSDYTITGQNNETMTGTWSYAGYTNETYPNAGTSTVTLTWTPSGDCATNYKSATYSVTLTVNKRDVTVAPADSTVTYGASAPKYELTYSNLAACDETYKATWLANSTFEVYYDNSWQTYASTMVPGTYDMRIATYGGDTTNNNYTTSGTSKLTINKAPIYYTAAATDRIYNGTATVDVTLSYAAGVVNGDNYYQTLTTTGSVANGNAAEGKTVTVITDGIDFPNSDKYYISIQNNPTVNISKATPTATAETYSFTYDSTRTLAQIALDGEPSVAGSWAWKNSAIVPTVDVTNYTAIFTPADTTNYNTIEVPVTINVAKKEVEVSVEAKTVAYGDASPSLNLSYSGFTGSDTIDTVATTGTVAAATSYSMGQPVGSYPITITMTDYEAVNYSFKAVNSTITVEKKNVTVTAPSGSVTYGDTAPEYTVDDIIIADDALYGTDTLATLADAFYVRTEYVRGNGAGTYRNYIDATDTANYTFTCVDGVLTVKKAVLTVTADDKTISYGQVKPSFTYTFSGYKFSDTDTEPTGAPTLDTQYSRGDNAGQYAISIAQGTLAHANYTFNLVGGTLTVEKLTPDTTSVIAHIVHGEAYTEATFEDTAIGTISGIFTLKDTTAIADYTDSSAEEDAELGKYIIVTGIFTPTDSDNYNSVEVEVYLVIAPHAISGTPVISGTPMVDETLTANVNTMSPSASDSYEYQWYVGGTAAGTATTYTVKEADIGKEIYITVTAIEDKGYTGTASSASVTAQKKYGKEFSIDAIDYTLPSATYDANAHPATVAPKSGLESYVGDITVYYNGSTTAPVKAGSYVVTIDVGTAEAMSSEPDNCYRPVSGLELGTIVISKATVTATVTAEDRVYDGTRKVYNYNVTINGVVSDEDAVYLDSSLMSITYEKAAAGEQGIIVSGLKLAGTDASNYTLVVNTDDKAVISKATLTAKATGVTRTYNGSAQVDVTIYDIAGYASIDSASTVYVASASATATSVNAGTWTLADITYTLGGASANNYVLEVTNASSAQVTITKAVPTVTAPTVTGLVYDANRTLGNIILTDYYVADSNGYWQFDDTTVVPTVKKTAYNATYISTNSNYDNYSTTITVITTAKEVTLTAENTTVTYGKAASYSVKAEGFTGSDSLATMGGTQPTFVCGYYAGQPVATYNIKINHNLDSNGNYTFVTKDGTLTVVPATIYATATATNRDYNGSDAVEVKFAISSGKYGTDDVALSYASANGVASSANAGTRTVTYSAPSLTGTAATNYELVVTPASGILTVVINKLDPEGYVFPTSATIEFGRDLSWAVFTDDAAGDGTFAFTSSNIPNGLGLFSYEVSFTPKDSVNYNTVYKYIPLTVTECQLNYVVSVSGTAQVGQRLTALFTGLPSKAMEYIQYQWYRIDEAGNASAISGATGQTYEAVEQDVGYTLGVFTYFNADAPYVFADGANTDVFSERTGILGATISSIAEENLTFWQRLIRWIQSIIDALTGITWAM